MLCQRGMVLKSAWRVLDSYELTPELVLSIQLIWAALSFQLSRA